MNYMHYQYNLTNQYSALEREFQKLIKNKAIHESIIEIEKKTDTFEEKFLSEVTDTFLWDFTKKLNTSFAKSRAIFSYSLSILEAIHPEGLYFDEKLFFSKDNTYSNFNFEEEFNELYKIMEKTSKLLDLYR